MQPATEAELAEMVRKAPAPLCIRGGGTRGIGAASGVDVSTAALSGVTLYEPGALTLVAQAGTPLAEIEAILARKNQHLAFEPPDFRALLGRDGQSTIGGVVASNASGPRRIQVGACRDSLLGVRFVDGRGDIIRNGGRVMKNVTGYDLVKLMAGSRGSLGALTEVSLKLWPRPAAEISLCLPDRGDAQAVAAMAAGLGSPYDISGAAYWPGRGVFLRIEGFAASVAYRADSLVQLLAPFGPGRMVSDDTTWREIRDVRMMAEQPGDIWRVVLRASDAPGLIARAGDIKQHLMDWGGGLLWLRLAAGTDLRARLGQHQGHATRLRAEAPEDGIPCHPPDSSMAATLSAGVRRMFDPRGLFSPPTAKEAP